MATKPKKRAKRPVRQRERIFTQSEIYTALVLNGMPSARAKVGSAIAMAESRGRKAAVNVNSNGTKDVGPFQINDVHGASVQARKGLMSSAALAKRISKNGTDWSPWVAYSSGAYQQFMDADLRQVSSVTDTRAGGSTAQPGQASNLSLRDQARLASFSGGLPGTQLVGTGVPYMPGVGPLDLPFYIPGLPDSGSAVPGLGNPLALPQQIEDTFRLINRMFEAEFWYGAGKVILGIGAVSVGVIAVMKASGVDPVGAVKNAASLAATKGAGKLKG